VNYWRSPKILEQAVVVHQLLARNYPNDEIRLAIWWMGFPVELGKARRAWLSRLGKLKLGLEAKKARAERRQGSKFFSLEDEMSALATPIAQKLSKQFGLNTDSVVQPMIDLFSLTFANGYVLEPESLEPIIEFYSSMLAISLNTTTALRYRGSKSIIRFLKNYMSYPAVLATVQSASETDFNHAHRIWRRILRILQSRVRQLIPENQLKQFLACGFGRICVPAIMQLIREGKSIEIHASLAEIEEFAKRHDAANIVCELFRGNRVERSEQLAIRDLLQKLGEIWDHKGFQFS
jgi:hypothetical protein